MKKTILALTCSLYFASALVPCSNTITADAAKKKVSISFSKSTDMMEKGTKFRFKAKVKNAPKSKGKKASKSKVIWKTSNAKVVSINKNTGQASAKKVGKATITAMIGNKLVSRAVTVAPSAKQLTNANDTAKNLNNNTYRSIYTIATSTLPGSDSNIVYREYLTGKGQEETAYRTVEGSYFSYQSGDTLYSFDTASNAVTVTSAAGITTNSFTRYSNAELISAYINEDGSYTLAYMSNIEGMTSEEQESVGLDAGICVMSVVVEKSSFLLREYEIKNYDSNGAAASSVKGTFIYNEECELELPEQIQTAITPE